MHYGIETNTIHINKVIITAKQMSKMAFKIIPDRIGHNYFNNNNNNNNSTDYTIERAY